MENKKTGVFQGVRLLWKFMGKKEKITFIFIFAFSIFSSLAWMYFNLVPPLVLASLCGEPVKFWFIDFSALSTISLVLVLMAVGFSLWVIAMTHYYMIDVFARKMICVVAVRAQDIILMQRKNLDFGMTNGEVSYIVNNATESVYSLIEPLCWNVVTTLMAVTINLVVLFTIDWLVGLIGIIMIALILSTVFLRLRVQNPVIDKIENTNAQVANQMLTSLQNLPLITMLKSQLEEKHQLGILNKVFFKFHKKRARIGYWYWIAIIALEYISVGVAVILFLMRNGTSQAIASVTMIFTILYDIQSTIEDWGWELGDLQASAIKICGLEKLYPSKESLLQAERVKNLSLYDEKFTSLQAVGFTVKLGKFHKVYNCKFESGKAYLLAGPSGCGKTTLINAICGLREVQNGELLINEKYALKSLANFSNKISYMFQHTILFDRSIEKNIAYPRYILTHQQQRLAKKFGMDSLIKREGEGKEVRSVLSGGEQLRINFIRAISREADLYLLDEPTNELDAENVKKVLSEIDRLRKNNKITIIISHDKRVRDFVDEVIEL